MTWRAWLRVLAFTLALLFVWGTAYTIVEYAVARQVSEARRAEKEHQLIQRMIEAGRSIEEIRRAIEDLDRRYEDGR